MSGNLNNSGGGGVSGAPYGGSHGGAAPYYGGTMPFNGMMNRPDQNSQYPPAGYGAMPPQMQMFMNPMNMPPRMMPPWPGRPMMMPVGMGNGPAHGWEQGRESSCESSRSSNFSGSHSRSRSRGRSWSRGRSRSRSRERNDRRRSGNDKERRASRCGVSHYVLVFIFMMCP